MKNYHEPVLLDEVVEGLNIKENGIYVDATFGGGGHSRAILEKLKRGKLIAFDQDEDAKDNLPNDDRIIFFSCNFRFMKNFMQMHKLLPVDGVLADLGVSSHQLEMADRGFSTRFSGPLDMRMSKSEKKTAAEIVNEYDEKYLTEIFKTYGEIKEAKKLAKEIAKQRICHKITKTEDLIRIAEPFAKKGRQNKFLAQVFQALRIEVNDELLVLKDLLEQSKDVLKDGGRLVIISYHSLEDRLVKNFIKSGNFEGEIKKDFYGNKLAPFKPVKKLIVPDDDEINRNKRARSAKLRIAEKIDIL